MGDFPEDQFPADQFPDDWRRRARAELKGRALEDLIRPTHEGIAIRPLYTAADLADVPHLDSTPGAEPFLRGVRATMYANRPWTIRQYAGFSTAGESNAFYRAALASGQQGVSVAFDLATHRGYDSDHPRVEGDVGKAGVAIDSVEDMKLLFDGIPLDRVSVSMTMNGAVIPVMAAFIAAAGEQGVEQAALSGTIQNDILKEFMVRNTYIYPPDPSMRITADVIEHAAQNMPRFHSISISGYHMHEAGADLVQELAFTLADGREYVRAALGRGMKVDDFAPRLSFFFAVGMDFFMEIAKLRAARLLWAEIMQGFGASDPRSLMLRMHCQTSGVSLQADDPWTNIMRTAYEAMAAALGGTQSLHTNSFDEALALPSDFAARIARNTQLVLQEETGITRTVDPLGGSYFIERLTHDLAGAARVLLAEIEDMGGMTRAVARGLPRARIEETAARRQAALDAGETVVVGVNRHRAPDTPDAAVPEIRRIDNHAVRQAQIERLQALRATRDESAVLAALDAVESCARDGGNLLQAAIPAARARATIGEISMAMEKVFGRHHAASPLRAGVYGAARAGDAEVQAIRAEAEDFLREEGRRPRILVAKLGQDGHDRGARVIAAGLADLGFDVDVGPLFQTPEEAARDAIDNDVHVVGLSSQAAGHLTLAPRLVAALRAQGAGDILVVCGGVIPAADHAALQQAGIAAIHGPGTPVTQAARDILQLIRAARGRDVPGGSGGA